MKHGILLINKPAGITSHEAVQAVRKTLHEKKVGHLGTLDPFATGLLVAFVGKKALKTIELFHEIDKEYEARVQFGKLSSTYDPDGVIEEVPEKKGWKPPTQVELNELLRKHFLGSISQVPPMHSAVHVDGKKAYKIMHNNPDAELVLPERVVEISNIQLVSYDYPEALLRIACSTGTYIRSIAHDLGHLMRCGAYLKALKRTRVGSWHLEDANELADIAWGQVIPLKDILSHFERIDLTDEDWDHIQHGRIIEGLMKHEPFIAWHDDLPVAILERKEGGLKARKVL